MPRSQPKTFDVAVKHLFRHLHDRQGLRDNPIAGHVFETLEPDLSPAQDAALLELHSRIVSAARRCRDEDLAAGKAGRAVRQFGIVQWQCIEQRPIADVASRLGLSVKHCYRERAQICRRIARHLVEAKRESIVVTPRDEGFYVLLERILEPQSNTPVNTIDALKYLHDMAGEPHQKISVLHDTARLFVDLGRLPEAEINQRRAQRLYEENFFAIPSGLREMLLASANSVDTVIAVEQGEINEAFRAASAAATRADAMRCTTMGYARSLWLNAQFNLATMLWNTGDLEGAYDLLCRAALRPEWSASPPGMQAKFQGALWKLRSHLLATKTTRYPSRTRIDGLKKAYNRAYQAGDHADALEAMISIVECQIFARRDDEALQFTRTAVALAKQLGNPIIKAQLGIDLGVRLLYTKFWREGTRLLPPPQATSGIGAYYRNLLNYACALGALRAGQLETARRWASDPTSSLGSPSLQLRLQMLSAEAAYLSGYGSVAHEQAAAIVDSAERLGSTPILAEAFTLASKVLSSRQYRLKAEELARIMAS